LTKPIHPRSPIVIQGVKPKRIRRTKAQMDEARGRAELEALWAEARVIAEKRLAQTSPAEKRRATRLLARWEKGPKWSR
jgi:hypothetical protein